MNIIKYLTQNVTSVVCTTDQQTEEIALLEEFYSIVLARMTDTKAYNQLTKNNKLPTKKLTLYKVINNVSWNKEQSAQKIIEKLSKNHDCDEEKVKGLLKQVTPRIFSELKELSDKKPIPTYLKTLLLDPETSFTNFIPSWASDILPERLLDKEVLSIHDDLKNEDIQIKKSISKDAKTSNSQSEKSEVQTKEPIKIQKSTEDKQTKKGTTENKITKNQKYKDDNNQNKPNSDKKEDSDSKLPKPVHADPSNYSFENISKKLPESILDEQEKDSNRFLPFVGLAIIGILFWALLRGCQGDSTEESQNISLNSQDTDIVSLDKKDTKSNDKINQKRYTTLIMSTNQSGQLLHAEIFTGSASITNNIKDDISRVFDEKAKENTKVTIDKTLNDNMPTRKKLGDLINLIKGIPNTTIKITGNTIVFNTPDKNKQQELINEAQFILSGFKVSSGNENIKKGTDDDSHINNEGVSKLLKLQANDLAVVKLEQPMPKTQKSKSQIETKVIKSKEKNTNSKPTKKLDVATEVNKSINNSKRALDRLGEDANLEALEQALNMQIINFSVNENKIPKENQAILNQAAKILKRANAKLKIIGHTDSDGNEEYNKRLSQDRSFAIKKYLMSQGIKSENMTTAGVGESDPIADNTTLEGKFRNRRIEFKVYKSKKTK